VEHYRGNFIGNETGLQSTKSTQRVRLNHQSQASSYPSPKNDLFFAATTTRNAYVLVYTLVSNSSQDVAIAVLRDSGWNVEIAVNNFYNNGGAAYQSKGSRAETVSTKQIDEIFNSFKGILSNICSRRI
jgi:hypothetical protein